MWQGIPRLKLTRAISARILSEWRVCINEMGTSASNMSPSDPVTPRELRRVALTVALAISNSREYLSIFPSSSN